MGKLSVSGIICFNQPRPSPARDGHIAVGPDIISCAIKLRPDRDGIAGRVKGDLGTKSASGICFNECGGGPARAGHIAVGPDIISYAIRLIPDGQGMAGLVKGNLGISSVSEVICFNECGGGPASAGHIAVGPDIISCALQLLPDGHGIAGRVKGDLGIKSASGICFNECGGGPARAGHIAVGPDIISCAIKLRPDRAGIAGRVKAYLGIKSVSEVICFNE